VVPKLQQYDADRMIGRETWRAAGQLASWAWPRPRSSTVRAIDARIQRIFGGTNEIVNEIIRRDLVAGG
jgi:alkylation response protein AidB-like acyl-CoA dehydrogenase